MRSSRSDPDPLDPGPAGFAHRGLHDRFAPENSLAAAAAALDIGAGIECDLRLTSDDQIVLFHDRDASRLCASPVKIGRSSLKQLSTLRISTHPIAPLAALLSLVRGRVPLLLEAKVDHDVWRWVPALIPPLTGYDGPFGIMSFDPRIARLLKIKLPNVRRGLIVRAELPDWKRRLALSIADPQFIAVERTALEESWVASARRSSQIYTWTIRTAAERVQAMVHADALIWEADGRPRA